MIESLTVYNEYTYVNKEYFLCSNPPIMSTDTTKPYIPTIPAITTGMIFFMMSSGLMTPIFVTPTPDFAVPYAAPNAIQKYIICKYLIH